MSETNITVRKFKLKPAFSNNKVYLKNVVDFLTNDYNDKICYYQKKIETLNSKDKKDDKKIEAIQKQINNVKAKLDSLDTALNLTPEKDLEKMLSCELNEEQVKLLNDYNYTKIRKMCSTEAQQKNYVLSTIFSQLNHNSTPDEINAVIKDTFNKAQITKVQADGRVPLFTGFAENINGSYSLAYMNSFKAYIKKQIKDGVLTGKVSLRNYKEDGACFIKGEWLQLYTVPEVNSLDELKNAKIYFGYGSSKECCFLNYQVIMPTGKKKNNAEELYSVLYKLLTGEVEFCSSTLMLDGHDIILNLSIDMPVTENELDENTVVGVDVGVAVPAMCAVYHKDNPDEKAYIRKACGNGEDLLRIRSQITSQRRRCQKSLKYNAGGHGRAKKLTALDRFKAKEANFAETYNHKISREVVDFALKHKAKYIHLENLKGYGDGHKSNFILGKWSYYQLQQMIEYKAKREGIEVKYVNPCYTSKVCSVCNTFHPKNRVSQRQFYCQNPKCKSHEWFKSSHDKTYHEYFNADFNAARNIAQNTNFVKKTDDVDTVKAKEAQIKYYKDLYGFDIRQIYIDYLKKDNKDFDVDKFDVCKDIDGFSTDAV